MGKQIVIINESHTLLPGQVALLEEGYETLRVPTEGWTLDEIFVQAITLFNGDRDIVFASPVPALLLEVTKQCFTAYGEGRGAPWVRVFHNDRRVAKEVPDGRGGVRLIHTVAPDGWVLV